ncbi:MAG: ABC transporter ATP-binding protein [Deltaproteobacteria bacterium]|nr:ABC transporter ATP-binding protein [Deltaproteobacteria bacterium]
MAEAVIELRRVAKSYRSKPAVKDLELEVPRGSVTGLVGPNGAGKTTTIRMILGLERPSSGSLRVLGLDPVDAAVEVRRRVGYVPESHHMYPWMTADQLLDFASDVYPTFSASECERVVGLLGVPRDRKVKQMSRGEVAKLALTMALSHRPELLVLDEPTSGLDPLIRRDFLRAIVDLVHDDPTRTVLFSSHILSDVERIADRVVVLVRGEVRLAETMESLERRYTRASFLFPVPPGDELTIPGALSVERARREWIALFPERSDEELEATAQAIGARDVLRLPMSFDDVFAELVEHSASEAELRDVSI